MFELFKWHMFTFMDCRTFLFVMKRFNKQIPKHKVGLKFKRNSLDYPIKWNNLEICHLIIIPNRNLTLRKNLAIIFSDALYYLISIENCLHNVVNLHICVAIHRFYLHLITAKTCVPIAYSLMSIRYLNANETKFQWIMHSFYLQADFHFNHSAVFYCCRCRYEFVHDKHWLSTLD